MKKIAMILVALVATLAAAAQGPAEGSKAPDFTLPDAQGQEVSLSSLQGKWVVLDFWGSWCKWCIKGFPQMKENYEKLNKKVTFVGVACGDKKDAWEAALTKYELPWTNLWLNPEGNDPLLKTYGIQGFPTKLIIDPKGVIRNVTIGEDPEFFTILNSLVK